jgi:hypothetical protein
MNDSTTLNPGARAHRASDAMESELKASPSTGWHNESKPATNDTVRLSGSSELWKVIASINGTKVDIQRMTDYNLEIITVPLDSIQVVGHFGSPDTVRSLAPPNEPLESHNH